MHIYGFKVCLDSNNIMVKPKFQYSLKYEAERHSRDMIIFQMGLQLEYCFY
jgi:hypothetical protein